MTMVYQMILIVQMVQLYRQIIKIHRHQPAVRVAVVEMEQW